MLYQLFWLFLAFSFLGWCLEVAATAVRLGQYRDRGVLHGPLCLVYGITGCLAGCGIISTFLLVAAAATWCAIC